MATPDEIRELTKAEVGFSGPVGLGIRLVADYDVKGMRNFVTGANKTDYHLMNVNLDRDFKVDEFADIRYVINDDPCPRCNSGKLKSKTAIEIGHIFKLGTRYSQPLKAFFVDEEGKEIPIIMGCYGIGINRIVAAYIEQNYDEKGIIWNSALAPYQVIIICTNVAESKLSEMAEELYNYLSENGIEVLYDDRDVRAGIKFNDADLLGIPYQIIIGEKYLKEEKFELKSRDKKASYLLATKEDALKRIRESACG
jgi:prolyl-tRNA synthetase